MTRVIFTHDYNNTESCFCFHFFCMFHENTINSCEERFERKTAISCEYIFYTNIIKLNEYVEFLELKRVVFLCILVRTNVVGYDL